jgi:D-amino-acid oxidase
VAAALWYPYRARPRDAVTRWSAKTYQVLSELAGVTGTGVHVRDGVELLGPDAPDQPWWRSAVP